ncbi:PAS domain S-box protein [Achromobacter spanius]|uniref:sensor histidine kinase n=1 Tax=Achromobacter spanius TaxID=217203 RepID=UPI0038148472
MNFTASDSGVRTPPAGQLTEFEALVAAGPGALNAIPGAIYVCDGDGMLMSYNREAARLWGRKPAINSPVERFCGSHRLYLPDGTPLPHDRCPMATSIAEGTITENAEVIVEKPDGKRLTVLVNIRPLFDSSGAVQGAINCFYDISDRKALERESASYREQLEDFFENSVVAMHIVDEDGIVVRSNKAELNMLGYRKEQYVGHPVRNFHADEHVIDDILTRLRCGEVLVDYPARLRTADGSIRHVRISSSSRFCDGKFLSTRCCTIDVTERKELEGKIRSGERHLRDLLESLPAAVYTTDAQGRITFYNEAAAQLAGRRPTLGEDEWCVSWKLFHPDGRHLPHDQCPMAICLKEGRAVRGERAIIERPDGTRIPFAPYPTPLRDGDGNVIGAINMLVDISAEKQADERQKALIAELNHRVKNTLATVQSLMRRTARNAKGVEDFSAALETRILALARAHDLLSKRFWTGIAFATLVNDIVAPFSDSQGRLAARGFDFEANSHAALCFTMALNELATNAAKYGALHGTNGVVELQWRARTGGEPVFELEWTERGGPTISEPPHLGFGTSLITRCIERDLHGRCDLQFDRAGLRCRIEVPLMELIAHE